MTAADKEPINVALNVFIRFPAPKTREWILNTILQRCQPLLTIDNRSLPHRYTPGDMWDYDEEGSSILIDVTVDGQPRKVATHAARNGFIYTFERANGQILMAKPYVSALNWTKGIDQDREADRLRSQPRCRGLFGPAEIAIARSPECRPATMQGGLSGTVISPPGRAVP
jgi:hypothetical protein